MGLCRNKPDIYESIGIEEGRKCSGKVSQTYFSFQAMQFCWDGMKHPLCIVVSDQSLCNHHAFPIEETENGLQPAIHLLHHNMMVYCAAAEIEMTVSPATTKFELRASYKRLVIQKIHAAPSGF